MNTETPTTEAPRGALFWTLATLGWAGIAFGVVGLVVDGVDLVGFAPWFVGGAIVHDLLLAPVVLGCAWVIGRALPPPVAIPVKVGLAVSALVAVYAWPLVRGYGKSPAVPSALPLDYGRSVVIALLVVWSVVGVWAAAGIARRGKGPA